ncbi:MAG TPA: septal ring lytic transglycosylase RlpA family protein [Burkholderiaceae bacterium]|nr:septal ring lytic transglycosylase RlpA family protein [Burkholderiaceae bacterium]
MTSPRHLLAALLCLGLIVLAGCSSTGGGRGGGYYKDDGPGSDIPADIEAIPDAVPRIEKHAAANFRPYVVFGKRYVPVSDERPFRQEGTASWYGRKFHGKKTANGETYDMYAMSAAHPTLPIPSYARVTRAGTGKSVIVRINDRGPFHSSRIIDLSYVAAAKLGLIGPGSGQVVVEAITNQDIRNNTVAPPKTMPIPPAAPPPPVQEQPLLIARNGPATPDALDALQHDDGGLSGNEPLPVAAGQSPGDPLGQAVATVAGGLYLQFGAFSAMHTAQDLAQKLNDQIGAMESRSAQVQAGDKLYRVQIGPYSSRTEAVNAALRIQQQTGLQPVLAQR